MTLFHALGRKAARAAGLGAGELSIERHSLALPSWPRALDRLRVAVVADLHTGSPQVDERRLDEIVACVNREAPDMVALLGDYIDASVAFAEWTEPEAIAARLERFGARLGTYAVLGNHDWGHTGPRMARALAGANVVLLENRAIEVEAGGGGAFWIAGLGDMGTRVADLDRTLAQVPDAEPVLLLSHNPDVFPRVPARVALTLAGHTHGAQVNVPLLRDRVTPSRFGARYTGGHVEEGGRHLFVSDGIGTSRLPVRFRAGPVLPVLELRAWTSASH